MKKASVELPVARDLYRMMLLIRRFEEKCAEMYGRAKIGGFLHLYIGTEACAAGAIPVLQAQDKIVSHYRDHGHAIARGLETNRLMAELFGKVDGTSKGKGGSMHIFDVSKGFLGGYAIVGGQMPIAVGLAFAAKYRKENRICLCIFGDGAVQEGEFHEAMNMASLYKLPVVFMLENNGFGMGTKVERAYSGTTFTSLAAGYKITAAQCDGMDVLAVREAASTAFDYARSGKGPYFLEAITYRFRGHSMADPIQYRQKDEEQVWRARDPILGMRKVLESEGMKETDFEKIEQSVEKEIEDAVAFAEASPNPPIEAIWEDIVKE